MTKKVFLRTLMIVTSLVIIVGIIIMNWVFNSYEGKNVIKVKLNDGQTEALQFDNLALIPGESCEYKVKLKRGGAAEFDLHLSFDEKEDHGLGNFARVKISSGDELLYDELLAVAFEKCDVIVPVSFKEDEYTEFTVEFYLPIEVGNEAKNAGSVFELILTANNE